jgi:hypothetical protein
MINEPLQPAQCNCAFTNHNWVVLLEDVAADTELLAAYNQTARPSYLEAGAACRIKEHCDSKLGNLPQESAHELRVLEAWLAILNQEYNQDVQLQQRSRFYLVRVKHAEVVVDCWGCAQLNTNKVKGSACKGLQTKLSLDSVLHQQTPFPQTTIDIIVNRYVEPRPPLDYLKCRLCQLHDTGCSRRPRPHANAPRRRCALRAVDPIPCHNWRTQPLQGFNGSPQMASHRPTGTRGFNWSQFSNEPMSDQAYEHKRQAEARQQQQQQLQQQQQRLQQQQQQQQQQKQREEENEKRRQQQQRLQQQREQKQREEENEKRQQQQQRQQQHEQQQELQEFASKLPTLRPTRQVPKGGKSKTGKRKRPDEPAAEKNKKRRKNRTRVNLRAQQREQLELERDQDGPSLTFCDPLSISKLFVVLDAAEGRRTRTGSGCAQKKLCAFVPPCSPLAFLLALKTPSSQQQQAIRDEFAAAVDLAKHGRVFVPIVVDGRWQLWELDYEDDGRPPTLNCFAQSTEGCAGVHENFELLCAGVTTTFFVSNDDDSDSHESGAWACHYAATRRTSGLSVIQTMQTRQSIDFKKVAQKFAKSILLGKMASGFDCRRKDR